MLWEEGYRRRQISTENTKSLQLECAMVLHESFYVLVLMCGIEAMVWRDKGRCRIRADQINHLRSWLGLRRKDKILNELVS